MAIAIGHRIPAIGHWGEGGGATIWIQFGVLCLHRLSLYGLFALYQAMCIFKRSVHYFRPFVSYLVQFSIVQLSLAQFSVVQLSLASKQCTLYTSHQFVCYTITYYTSKSWLCTRSAHYIVHHKCTLYCRHCNISDTVSDTVITFSQIQRANCSLFRTELSCTLLRAEFSIYLIY